MRKVYLQIKFPELSYFPQELRERGRKAELIARDNLEALMGLQLSRGWKTKIRFQNFSIICLPDYVDRNRRLIVEVKSVRSVNDTNCPRGPAKRWLGQLNLYMFALSYQNGILVQIRDSHILGISEVSFDKDLVEEAIAYFESLSHFIKNNELPDKDETVCRRFCRFCSFSEMCALTD